MDTRDREFVERRRKFAKSWNEVGAMLLLALGAMVAVLFVKAPLLVNPWLVMGRIRAGNLEPQSLELMAALLPVVVLLCFGVCAVVVIFGFAVFRNERRYLAIIDALRGEDRW